MCHVTLKYSDNTANMIDQSRRKDGHFNLFDSANGNAKYIIHTIAIIILRWLFYNRDRIAKSPAIVTPY